jgi:hypothetical protein
MPNGDEDDEDDSSEFSAEDTELIASAYSFARAGICKSSGLIDFRAHYNIGTLGCAV